MNMNDLRPAKEFALNFGVKTIIYGKAGSGKTPVCASTAPRPVLLFSEPGMGTLKVSLTPSFPAFGVAKIDEFFEWFTGSAETKNFDTLIWDSASQGAEIYVDAELAKGNKSGGDAHGKRAYGQMARKMMDHLNKLYFMPQKHIVLVCKMYRLDINGVLYHRPYFPGIELNTRVPHLFDLVMCLGDWNIPGVLPVQPATGTKAFHTRETYEYQGRDRSGNLEQYEPPRLDKIFEKCMR